MGLDIYIYKNQSDNHEIGYFRKFYDFRDYWIEFARKNYQELQNGYGDFNTVYIPCRKKDWEDCIEYFTKDITALMKKKDIHILKEIHQLLMVNEKIVESGVLDTQEFIYIYYWE